MGIIEGPCGYSTRLVGTQGKLVFRPWVKVSRWEPDRCFGGVQQSFVARDWDEAQVCDPWIL